MSKRSCKRCGHSAHPILRCDSCGTNGSYCLHIREGHILADNRSIQDWVDELCAAAKKNKVSVYQFDNYEDMSAWTVERSTLNQDYRTVSSPDTREYYGAACK